MQSRLPPRANLRRLKNEAKTLIKHVRAGSTGAEKRLRDVLPELSQTVGEPLSGRNLSLKNAQRAVAREYGFEGWAQLTQHLADAASAHRGLDAELTFDAFDPKVSNPFAVWSARKAVELSAEYNPLIFYGSNGSACRHLVHAIGNAIVDGDRRVGVVHVRSDDFMKELSGALETSSSMDALWNKYHATDVLLITDIQRFSNQLRPQEELFWLLKSFSQKCRQIVISCDLHPREMTELEDRIVARLTQGLIVEVDSIR